MPPLIRVDDGGGPKAFQVAHPTWLSARFTVDRGMVHRQYLRTRVNDMERLWPQGYLYDETLFWARRFVSEMEKQGRRLLSNEADTIVSGPFKHRRHSRAATEELVDASGQVLRTFKVMGQTADEDHDPDKADFVLTALFLETRGFVTQTNESKECA